MLSSSHGESSSHGSEISAMSVHSGNGRYQDASEFSLEKLLEDADSGDADAMKRLRRRRKYEMRLITRYNRTELENRSDDCWYLVDSKWLNAWYAFVKGSENVSPGQLSSRDLLDAFGQPLPGLRAKIDYRGVVPMVYYILVELYGKDPTCPDLCRYEVDIYARPLPTDRIIKVSQKVVIDARIQVSKVRPKWLKWERHYDDDEEDEVFSCCCGLTKEHLEAFIYWMVSCWSRRASGRGSISYRQYRPLRGVDDDPSVHDISHRIELGVESGSKHGKSFHNGEPATFESANTSVSGRMSMPLVAPPPPPATDWGGSIHGYLFGEAGTNTETVTNPLNSSIHSSASLGRDRSSHSVLANESEDAVGEQDDVSAEDDSDSDSDIEQPNFEVAPADVSYESGNWLKPF